MNYDDLFNKTRPELNALIDLFNFYDESYIGGYQYTNNKNNLHKHKLEFDYENRVKRASYTNLCSKYVNNIIKHIFGHEITRDGIDSLANIVSFQTLNGKSVDVETFMKNIVKQSLIKGEVYLFVDSPKKNADVTNSELINGEYQYTISMIRPQNIQYIQTDNGIINEIIINQKFTDTYGRNIVSLYFNNEILIMKIANELDQISYEEVYNNFQMVPVFKWCIDEDDNGIGESILRDAAKINNTIYNLESLAVEMCRDNVFPMFGLPVSQENMAVIDEMWGISDSGKVSFERKQFIPHDKDSPITTIQIDTKNFDNILNLLNYYKNQIKDILDQRMTELIAQSGISKSYDVMETNQMLSFLSEMYANLEFSFYVWLSKLINVQINPDTISLEYPKMEHFDVVIEKDRHIENIEYTMGKVESDTYKKIAQYELVRTVMGHLLTDKESEQIKKEIMESKIKEEPEFFGEPNNNLNNKEEEENGL